MRREERRRGSVARASVEHVAQAEQGCEADGERLPRPPWRVVPIHLAGERLGEAAASLGVERVQALPVSRERRVGRRGGLVEHGSSAAGEGVEREGVERLRSIAAVAHEARIAQPPEVSRHPRLRDPRHAHEVSHPELALAEQRAQADAALVAEEVQGFYAARQVHRCIRM